VRRNRFPQLHLGLRAPLRLALTFPPTGVVLVGGRFRGRIAEFPGPVRPRRAAIIVPSNPDVPASDSLLARIAPGLASLRRYRREDLPHDLAAGLSVAAVTVPVGIAHAQLAGFEPVVGLHASVLPLVAYAMFGTSRQLIVGTGAPAAAIIASAVAPLAAGSAALYQSLAVMLCIFVGLLCIGARFLRLGALADFLSRPILVGFMNGVALSIVLGQLGALFGFGIEAGGILPRLIEFAQRLPQTHAPTLAIGLASLGLLIAWPRAWSRVPSALVALVLAAAAVHWLGLEQDGVRTIGQVPTGLPTPQWPTVPAQLLPTLLAEAAGLALVSYSTMMLAARSFADRNRYEVDADRELAALGAANLAAALSQGFAVTGTSSRTAVAEAAGGRTQATGLVCAAALTLLLLYFTGPLRFVPSAAIAAVLVGAGLKLIDLRELKAILHIDPQEFWLSIIATVGVVVFGPINAILLVIALSLLRFVRLKSRPLVETLGSTPEIPGFVALEQHPQARAEPGLVLFRFNGPIVFFSAAYFKREALKAAAGADVRWFVIDMLPVSLVDTTGLYALRDTFELLRERGIVVGIARREPEWLRRAIDGGFTDPRLGLRYFPTLRQAEQAYAEEVRGQRPPAAP
jgi:high affinity sulfate transporter 1